MSVLWAEMGSWVDSRGTLLIPLILTIWIAWGDLKTRRIPNYLTLGTALGGLLFNYLTNGFHGLAAGFLGMALGFALLFLPYLFGGMGAGDVKALAALGAWLGPWLTVFLFCYIGIAGGLIALGYLIWRGLLRQMVSQGYASFVNLILCRPHGAAETAPAVRATPGLPYGVAFAVGMLILVGVGG